MAFVPALLNGIFAVAPSVGSSDSTTTLFLCQILVMLVVGRLLGEVMQRVGQPAVMGQLVAGILIGPSVLGKISPELHSALFAGGADQKKMISAVSEIGILMLLLLTGMETDLVLVKKIKRTAICTSVSGIFFPFVCGWALGEYLPDSLIPDPSRRLATALFLATALSISSVKIVAMIIMEVDFIRRTIGQVILASAILDDTIAWILIAMIGTIAERGTVDPQSLAISAAGTAAFLAFSFTMGKRIVAAVIRWSNDIFTVERPVVTAILALMLIMALITHALGVSTVLGAFVCGILVGQSPLLTGHIRDQLEGIILAFFMPIFFTVAGLSIDISVLGQLPLLKLACMLIAIATFGKMGGAFVGGLLGGLNRKEALALGIGMNARGSTEIIVATIGLSMGVFSQDLFTLIVIMAVATTLVTPPLLRWALTRIPPRGEEAERLKLEDERSKDVLPPIERLLVISDGERDGRLAAALGGLFAGTRQVSTTVLDLSNQDTPDSAAILKESAKKATQEVKDEGEKSEPPAVSAKESRQTEANPIELIKNELAKGYGMVVLGLAGSMDSGPHHAVVEQLLKEYQGVLAIVLARGAQPMKDLTNALNILLPTIGTDYSRRAAEIAIAIAKGSAHAEITALNVSAAPVHAGFFLRRNTGSAADSVVQDIAKLGEREGAAVISAVDFHREPQLAIAKRINVHHHNLVVLGVKARHGKDVFFGPTTAALLETIPCSVLLINS